MLATAAFTAYRLAFRLARPYLRRVLARRAAAGREEATRLGERWGRTGQPRPPGDIIWIHAASVGETVSVVPLIERLREDRPQTHILLTTVTTTAARRAAALLPSGALHQYLPLDDPGAVRRFFNHWRPAAGILVESEIWPTLIRAAKARGLPLALVNGRISSRSARSWSYATPLIRDLLSSFDVVLAQTPGDAERLSRLGDRPVACLGNLKFAGPPLPVESSELEALRRDLKERPVWLAASTHPSEETAVLSAHRSLAPDHPGLLTVIVPRHPERGREVAAEAEAAGLSVQQRSGGAPQATAEVYVADTLGELGLWYRLCSIAFVGGSLVDRGGQNPLEAARLGCALLFGPHGENNAAAVAGLTRVGALEQVGDAEELTAALGRLLENRELREARCAAGQTFTQAQAHIVEDVLTALEPLLKKI
ncbi:3-deoxy-D-manno-octulosonic acid transferase [Algihabitans albus]|uniref:3-deoxy-D-manno-octulosonic acid transferase n=1 Tax=Algihabitans albus TaxID=2164067 RepID=UPI000E5CFD0F|nr:3-deoxy-D-manno-octulosonic acid transferase [Algihabitans albus]